MSCPKCIEGHVLPGEPTGSFPDEFQGAYLAPGPEGKTGHGRAIILLTDAFGLALPNPKLIADTLARRLSCDVWVPDYFAGRPIIPANMLVTPERAEQKMTIRDWIRFIYSAIPSIPSMISNRSSVVDQRLISFFALLKEKKNYEKLGAVGYCFGGTTCVRLGSTDSVQAVVICHPGPFAIDQVRKIKVPASWVCAEVDIFFSDSLKLQAEAEFASRKDTDRYVDYEFKVYKGTSHGFGSRPNPAFEDIMAEYERAIDQKVEWFEKTLTI